MIALLVPMAAGGLLSLLLQLVILLIVAGLIFWAVNKLCAAFSVPEPVRTVIIVVLVIILVLLLLQLLFGVLPVRV